MRPALCAALVAGLLVAGCGQRRPAPAPPPAPPPPAPLRSDATAEQLVVEGLSDRDGGLAGIAGMDPRAIRQLNHYPDFPRSTPLPSFPRGKVELPPPPSTADADALSFDRKLRAARGLIHSCYERGLRGNPALAGEVTLEISLGADGQVLSVATPASSVGDEIPACLRARLLRLRFPPPSRGAHKTRVTVGLRPAPAPDAGAR